VSVALIARAIQGKCAIVVGRLFARYTGVETALPDHDQRVAAILAEQRRKMIANTVRHAVRCKSDGREFPSVGAAAEAYGGKLKEVSRVLNGSRKSWRGLNFEYA